MTIYYALVRKDQGSAWGMEFPGLPGCFSAADKFGEIVPNAREALSLWHEDNEAVCAPSLEDAMAEGQQALEDGAMLIGVPFEPVMPVDKLDAALDRVRVEAEEANIVNRGGALTALGECERALKHIAKRAETLSAEYENVEIVQDRGPAIEFSGRLLCETSFETRGGRPLEITLEVWETRGGALVAVSSSTLPGESGREDARALVVPPHPNEQEMHFAVMDFYQWENRARSMVRKIGWKLRLKVA
jgi:predicted RNase H-like HicB family nuclease